jgi:hypothetical protein
MQVLVPRGVRNARTDMRGGCRLALAASAEADSHRNRRASQKYPVVLHGDILPNIPRPRGQFSPLRFFAHHPQPARSAGRVFSTYLSFEESPVAGSTLGRTTGNADLSTTQPRLRSSTSKADTSTSQLAAPSAIWRAAIPHAEHGSDGLHLRVPEAGEMLP